jgi:ATP-dependent Clp protease ATP-binding subunit ClpX
MPFGDAAACQVDTRDVLFVVGGAFVHLEKLLMDSRHKSSIGFGNKVGVKC